MKLLLSLDGRPAELTLQRNGQACEFEFRKEAGESTRYAASLIEVEPGIFSILVGGRSYEVKVVPGQSGYYVDMGGHRMVVEVRDPRSVGRKGGAGGGEGRQTVNAPMPGKVVRVLVQEGDRVEAGAGLIVVEAMKMQNEMKAPKAGIVVQVTAREGSTVAAGEPLVAIE